MSFVYSKPADGVKLNCAVCANVSLLLTTRTPRYIWGAPLTLRAAREREGVMDEADETGAGCTPLHERRSVLKVALGTGLGLLWRDVATAQDPDPRNARPQEG